MAYKSLLSGQILVKTVFNSYYRRKALWTWMNKINARLGTFATYGLLLEKCLEGGDTKTAENICKLIQQGLN